MTKIKLITDASYATAWNRVVTHPLQTWEWGEIRQKTGNQILRLALVNDQDQIQQAFLFTLHSLPWGKQIINYAKGPFLPEAVWQYLKEHYHQTVLLVKLEPEVFIEEAGKYQLPIYKQHWQDNGLDFYLSKSPVFARHTFILDLEPNEAKLLSLMKSKTRYNINLARRKGVVIKDETSDPAAFSIFFKLYQQTIKRQNYLGHSQKYHQTVWEIMKQAGVAKILTAYYQNEPLSSYTLFFYKNTAYYLYGGSSSRHKEVMASNLLMWEALLLAKKQGMKYFDLWGALEKNYSPNHPWAGFHRFKEGYGGLHQAYLPTLDVVFDPIGYWFFSLLWPLRIKILELIRRFF
ncbi:hypothetical protein A2313_01165 [Candidatus Roizmanbacteria bacterium RIFOXYB2_FULL_41_10]|uniref:BioF2-like acetyltransferase domain-containing protein n=1 Tax=Candidatus Roizmanbacteria bacterium RIFOXYA1_FULL_41_12 TaxID=1802082 RepID=A0A1F7KF16_9BACT|nr:MAG: hypothetical protein A2262_04530 [Candidatus Roizmanbacteria bacterium RIFOXYA2_FULL_41_8]OGK66441.1 MAG: hypothetical protein A2209_01670 [Candidatus Roizmanbacteria bacterium RIFOXYA1_FULL_41_12]OGK68158.1 MAG: hypothetical protein A2377_04325 [Candidatus Roizmanbacteria bacterium RIFOXYB1_FULL_41_27]OGK69416.1 MAG: hypothetical protein A2313_01165 [Candidatus Roizmanbacteria bacterium RIFOXYB2_FULL_41_10]OGK71945.1 MAG: hypothetical protein A2403_03250 [Candidatus Roizmanbacteria bac